MGFFVLVGDILKNFSCRKVVVKVCVGSVFKGDGLCFAIDVENDIIVHEDFNLATRKNDISLIRTPQSMVFGGKYEKKSLICFKKLFVSANINVISLPEIDASHSEREYLMKSVIATGWGVHNPCKYLNIFLYYEDFYLLFFL